MRLPLFRNIGLATVLLAPASLRAQQPSNVQATPDSAFAVSKNGSSLLRVNQDGRVGIGTSTPDRRLSVNGTIGASDTIATAVGIRFPDGTLQTTAAANVTGTSANTPNTLVRRDSTGSFAAGKVTLDSLAVSGRATLGATNVSGRISASDTVSTGAAFRFPDGSVQTTAAATATGVSTNTPNTIVGRDANGSFAAGKVTLDSLSVAGTTTLGVTASGRLSASDTISTTVGVRFGDGSVQTTAATAASGVSTNTPNTIVGRDANGSFAAGRITLDSLAVTGASTLGRVSASDTISTTVGFRFPDGSVQTTAATGGVSGTSANTPNTLVQRDANGSFAAGQATLDSLTVSGAASLGSGSVVAANAGSLAQASDSVLAVRYGGASIFRVNRDAGVLAGGANDVGSLPATGAGVRMMWFPARWAFRAGYVNSFGATYWDLANVGYGSAAFGENTRASGNHSFAAGLTATASGTESVALGNSGTASGERSLAFNGTASATGAVAIGSGAQATSDDALAMGPSSIAGGLASIVLGPSIANGNFGVAIGLQNSASGQFSVAIGKNARTANRQGSVVIGDGCAGFSSDSVYPTANNQFVARGCGGIKLYTSQNLSSGVEVAAGGGSWSSISDRNRKENFLRVEGEDLLARLRQVPVSTWNYKTQDRAIRHMGPMAQDLYAAFGLGESDRLINTIDIDGVNMAGVQAVAARTDELRAQVQTLTAENAELRGQVSGLEARLRRLESLVSAQQARAAGEHPRN